MTDDERDMEMLIWGGPVSASVTEPAGAATDLSGPPVVQVDAGVFAQLRAQVQFGRDHPELLAAQPDAQRDAFLAAALADGRIMPTSLEGWRRAFVLDPAGTAGTISRLTAVAIPTSSVMSGQGGAGEAGFSEAEWDAFDRSIGVPAPPAAERARLAGMSAEDREMVEFLGPKFSRQGGS